jgi:two-component system chemotaxis response regulator CheY
MDDDLLLIYEAFVEESREEISGIEEGLLKLEHSYDDKDLVRSIFRFAHNIKGNSSSLGLDKLSAFVHHYENLLDRILKGALKPDKRLINVLLKGVDILKEVIDNFQPDAPPGDQRFDYSRCDELVDIMESYKAASADKGISSKDAAPEEKIPVRPHDIDAGGGAVKASQSGAAIDAGDGAATVSKNRPLIDASDSKSVGVSKVSPPLQGEISRRRFLIVEDDLISRKVMTSILSKYGDCDIAVNGQEAIEAFFAAYCEKKPYDVLYLDVKMPVMSGEDALRAIRGYEVDMGVPPSQEVKVVMTTSVDKPKDIMKIYYKGGCNDYVLKPVSKERIVGLLKKYGLVAE